MVGRNKAAEMLFSCEHIPGEEAAKIGLANYCVPHEELMTATRELANKVKNKAPLVIKYTKQALRRYEYSEDAREWVAEVGKILNASEDKYEAFTAILERREPVFKGK